MENNNSKKININELLERKRKRNATNKTNTGTNRKALHKQIKFRHKENIKDNLFGEAQIELQNDLLDAENEAIEEFNTEYNQMLAGVIDNIDAQADAEAVLIESADDVVYEASVKVIEPTNVLGTLPPRKSRFSADRTLFASDTKALPSSQTNNTSEKKNMFDV